MTLTPTQTMNANADPELVRLRAATRDENDENKANWTFLQLATKRFGQAMQDSNKMPMTSSTSLGK